MYEKIKDGEKRKTKHIMKSSKTKKKKEAINDLPDIETGEFVEKKVEEELKILLQRSWQTQEQTWNHLRFVPRAQFTIQVS